jgi:hypothetical protein
MQTFFSFACVVALICAIVFGIKAFKKKQKANDYPVCRGPGRLFWGRHDSIPSG